MKKILCALFGLVVFLIPTMSHAQSEIILRPGPGLNDGSDNGSANAGKDTMVSGSTPSTNYSSDPHLVGTPVSNCNPAMGKAYIQFDLATLPADVEQVLLGVTHEPHTSNCYSNCDADFYFYPVSEPWSEMTLTYDSMPSEAAQVYGPINISFPNEFGLREYDITNIYRNWKNNVLPNYGLAIYSPTIGCNNAAVMFYVHSSDDPDENLRPYLKIIRTTVSDDFNDNIKDKTLWGPDDGSGRGVLTERNRRLEYTVSTPGGGDDYSNRELIASQGTYTSNWEAQIDLFNGTKTSGGKESSVGMEIYRCDNWDDYIYGELYAADGGKSFYAELNTVWVKTEDLSGNLPLEGSMLISFDSITKVITLQYDIGSGWVPFGSFGISDAGGGTNGNVDWSMSDTDQFCFDIYGWSQQMAIGSGKIYADNFEVIGVTPPVSTRVLQPDGTEPVAAGDVYSVSWEAPLVATQFKLQYSIDNGTTWKAMAPDFVTGRSYDWTVPLTPNNKSKCLVKITGYDEDGAKIGTDVSAPFTIEVLKLDAPNGGEAPLTSESLYLITWTTNPNVPPVDHVQLSYTLDNGDTWKAINTSADPSDDGSFVWTVPKVTKDKNNCRVKVVLKDASGKTLGSDVSDGVFTIQPASTL